ncbi:MAG: PhoPQ-activated pathogenicity-related family protein [Planctomycetales bacterium]|nr:PhoPQ-activated pathogenicity-related family protein [Planctomycetales bacterium]
MPQLSLCLAALCLLAAPARGQVPADQTPLDQYLQKADDSYSWKIISEKTVGGVHLIVVDMISQTWRTAEEVDRPQWQHWLTLAIPEKVRSETGLLFIGGGANGRQPPAAPNERIMQISQATGTLVAELSMVPNQPLVFHQDGQRRTEDDLVGYTWDQYLRTGDPTWPARNPMVKSALRAMDTMTAVAAAPAGGEQTVNKFVVAGGSKRGWTTWLTGLDPRVVAIVPIVIDVVNAEPSMKHHFAAYGFWAPAVGDYVAHKIMERLDHPRLTDLYRLVDPYYYRHRLTMPKYILNAAGDQFFLPDSSQFYFDELQGEKYLRYVPNADHGLGGSDAQESLIAFYSTIVSGRPRPRFSWSEQADGAIRVVAEDAPGEVRLWQANNPEARDFRLETLGPKYTSSVLESEGDGVYIGRVAQPEQGWTAYFVELTYDVGAPVPLKLTTSVRVIPDVLPYQEKRPDLPTTISIVCEAESEEAAKKIVGSQAEIAQRLDVANFTASCFGKRCYFNWKPQDELERPVVMLTEYLKQQKCKSFQCQLESGAGTTGAKP